MVRTGIVLAMNSETGGKTLIGTAFGRGVDRILLGNAGGRNLCQFVLEDSY
jgi:hypothetical protein